MTVAPRFIAHLSRMLAEGGTDGSFVYADTPDMQPMPVRFLLNHPGLRDESIINAYGVNALILTFPATPEFKARPPRKFDLVVFDVDQGATGAKPYALDSVKLHQANNTAVAWTAYLRGKDE